MKEKKKSFFIKLKNSIINFDEYKEYHEEKTSIAVKYFFKLLLLFTLILSIALCWKVIDISNKLISEFKNECPEFNFQENNLIIEGDNKRIVKGDNDGYFGLIVDSEKENLSDIEESLNYQRVVGILKDKVVIKSVDGIESNATYKQLNDNYDIVNLNKGKIMEALSRK